MTELAINRELPEQTFRGRAVAVKERVVLVPSKIESSNENGIRPPKVIGLLRVGVSTSEGEQIYAIGPIDLEEGKEAMVGSGLFRAKPGLPDDSEATTFIPDSPDRRKAVNALDQAGTGNDLSAMAGMAWAIKKEDLSLARTFVAEREWLDIDPEKVTRVEIRTGVQRYTDE